MNKESKSFDCLVKDLDHGQKLSLVSLFSMIAQGTKLIIYDIPSPLKILSLSLSTIYLSRGIILTQSISGN